MAPYAVRSVGELLENVDMAVYHVKRNGKNGSKVFDTLIQEKLTVKEEQANHEYIYQEYESMIYALTAAIDTKDHYTFQYSKNAAYYATEFAKALNLNSDVIEIVRQDALLHDIGRTGIPVERVLKILWEKEYCQFDLKLAHVFGELVESGSIHVV